MITAIANSIQPSASDSIGARPIRVVTNASPAACKRLQRLGFAVQPMDNSSAVDIDADIVVIDRTITALWNPLDAQKIKSPVVFVSGLASHLASPQADYGSEALNGDSDGSTSPGAPTSGDVDLAPEGLTCGKLQLRNSCGFWNGSDLDLTIGEYKLVELLASRPGHCFNYRAIYDRLRHEGFVAGEGPRGYWVNVRSSIRRIRAKFRALDPDFAGIENYPAVGYGWRVSM